MLIQMNWARLQRKNVFLFTKLVHKLRHWTCHGVNWIDKMSYSYLRGSLLDLSLCQLLVVSSFSQSSVVWTLISVEAQEVTTVPVGHAHKSHRHRVTSSLPRRQMTSDEVRSRMWLGNTAVMWCLTLMTNKRPGMRGSGQWETVTRHWGGSDHMVRVWPWHWTADCASWQSRAMIGQLGLSWALSLVWKGTRQWFVPCSLSSTFSSDLGIPRQKLSRI